MISSTRLFARPFLNPSTMRCATTSHRSWVLKYHQTKWDAEGCTIHDILYIPDIKMEVVKEGSYYDCTKNIDKKLIDIYRKEVGKDEFIVGPSFRFGNTSCRMELIQKGKVSPYLVKNLNDLTKRKQTQEIDLKRQLQYIKKIQDQINENVEEIWKELEASD